MTDPWLLFALLAALFDAATAILAKIGVKNTDPVLAMAIRTIPIIFMAWIFVGVTNAWSAIWAIDDPVEIVTLLVSSLGMGIGWLFFFMALRDGPVDKAQPIGRSTISVILIAVYMVVGIALTAGDIIGMVVISAGVALMIDMGSVKEPIRGGGNWVVYVLLAAVFMTVGLVGMNSMGSGIGAVMGVALRVTIIAAVVWTVVGFRGDFKKTDFIDDRSWHFLVLSGLTLGLSWLCLYASFDGGRILTVMEVYRASIVFVAVGSYFVLKERLEGKYLAGLLLMVVGLLITVLL
jgi:transporter family protein